MKVQVKRGERNARQQGTEKEEEAHACAQRNPSGILNRLTVPDDRIHRLKKRADAELMRLYMRSGDYSDIVSLSTTLALGRGMLKFVDDPEPIRARITDAQDALAAYDPTAEVINLDAVRDALDLCYRVWRLVSVNEFVAAARTIKEETAREEAACRA